MKATFISLILFTSLFKCYNDSNYKRLNSGMELQIDYKGSYKPIACMPNQQNDSLYNFLFIVNLRNTADKPLTFIISDCSLVSFIVLNSRDLNLLVNDCARNSLIPIELRQNQKLSFPIIVQANKKFAYSTFKMGFVLMDEKTELEDFYYELHDRKNNFESIIWSPEIELIPGKGEAFEVGNFIISN